MARNIDPVCKMCRREQMKLFLKGERCFSPKCPIDKELPPPGMHGLRRGKQSEYGLRLREKQKLKRFYGVLEAQIPPLLLARDSRRWQHWRTVALDSRTAFG